MPNQPPVLDEVKRLRAALLRGDAAEATRLINAYGRAYQKLKGDIDALAAAIAELGPNATWGQVERLSLYRALLRQIQDEIGKFSNIAENELNDGANAAIAAALRDAQRLVQAALPSLNAAEIRAVWSTLNPDAVLTMLGFLGADSPLYINLSRLGPDVAALVAEKLREGIILGYNPRKVAQLIVDATGQGLTWALRTARTANLYAYRLSTQAVYQANAGIVTGWVWWAELGSPRTCMSCVNMHGSVHSVDEVLNDHHQGRCAMLPTTRSYAELGFPGIPEKPQVYQTGAEWFAAQSAAMQQQLMGRSMWDAWKAGEFSFSDLSVPYQDDVYGEMLREASLKGLLGAQAQKYYRG
jgi:hypothetical protein